MRTAKNIIIIFCTIILIGAAVFVFASCINTDNTESNNNYYLAQFHRGGRDSRPENTLYAYTYAIEEGATVIEADMQMTKDNVIVMSHTPLIDSNITQDENGNYVKDSDIDIRTLNYSDIQKYNVGHIDKSTQYYQEHGTTQIEHDAQIPTLEQLFQLVQDSGNKDILLNLETKLYPDPATGKYNKNNVDANRFAEKFVELTNQYDMSKRVIVQSFDWSVFPIIKKLNPGILTCALWSETNTEDQGVGTLWIDQDKPSPWLGGLDIHDYYNDPINAAFAINCDMVSPEFGQITQYHIQQAHNWGLKVIPWTVNTKEEMETCWEYGCDGIISDKGWLLREFLESKGASLPNKHPFDSIYHLD